MARSRLASLLVLAGVLAGVVYLGWLVVAQWPASPLLEAKDVPRGDQEVAWVHLATSGSTWERFVEGVHHAQALLRHASPPVQLVIDDTHAFPASSSATPELSLQVDGEPSRLWVRYYKLTSETNAEYWVRELAARKPAPVALIGGMSTDQARDLSRALREQKNWQGDPPAFLIATATADRVAVAANAENALPGGEEETEDLTAIYPGRTFRFCYTNSQMAQAVTHFIWSEKSLRPQSASGPVYLVSWKDDPYSLDLTKQFYDAIWPPSGATEPVVSSPGPAWKRLIPYSIGSYNRPNAREAEIADRLIDELNEHPRQDPALLILPAASQPARRFLRAMVQTDPVKVERFVAATGDYIDFNSVCRDRNLAWPIQDLPVRLVFFCHRNPIDHVAGFTPSAEHHSSSTDDKLLYADMAETLARAVLTGAKGRSDGLHRVLAEMNTLDGQRRFDEKGNLRAGRGECVAFLQPQRSEPGRVLPWALLHVYRYAAESGTWELVETLKLNYAGRSVAQAGRGSP